MAWIEILMLYLIQRIMRVVMVVMVAVIGVTMIVAVVGIIAISGSLRHSEHALYPARDAAHDAAYCATNDRADRPGRIATRRSALSRAAPDPLSRGRQRHGHTSESSGDDQYEFHFVHGSISRSIQTSQGLL